MTSQLRQRRWKELEALPREARRRWQWLTRDEVGGPEGAVGFSGKKTTTDGARHHLKVELFHPQYPSLVNIR